MRRSATASEAAATRELDVALARQREAAASVEAAMYRGLTGVRRIYRQSWE